MTLASDTQMTCSRLVEHRKYGKGRLLRRRFEDSSYMLNLKMEL